MEDLIARLKTKDEKALEEVMILYKDSIYRYLFRMLKDFDKAEDLAQETFVKVYFKASSIKTNNLKAWIYAIATNLAKSEFRKIKIRNFLSFDDLHENSLSYKEDNNNNLILGKLFDKLSPKYRIPLIMKEIEGFSYKDIAEILKKPQGTIKSLVSRAKLKIKEEINREEMRNG